MKRMYITAMPLQSNFRGVTAWPVNPVNFTLRGLVKESAFPIVPIVAETAQPSDEVIVLVVRQQNEPQNVNLDLLKQELEALQLERLEIRDVAMPETQEKNALFAMFSRLLDQVEDNACYYACMTYGTKTYPLLLLGVLSYVDKLLENTSVKGIYYQELLRKDGVAVEAKLYDMTGLFSLNAVIDAVAELDGDNKTEMIRMLLNG